MRTKVMREYVEKRPFLPFVIKMADGSSLDVRHPEMIAVGREAIFVSLVDDKIYRIIEPLLIQALEFKGDYSIPLPSNFKPRRDDDFDPDNEV